MTSNETKSLNFNKNHIILFRLFLLFSFLAFSFVSLNNFISHSEFWSITSAKLLGGLSSKSTHLYYKSFFYFILKAIYYLNLSNVNHILASRLLFGWIAFLCFYIFLKEILRLTQNYFSTIFYGIFLLSFQIYFYNLYRVRADLLSFLFIALAFRLINIQYFNSKIEKYFDIKLSLLLLFSFLATPKSIYMICAALIYHCFLNKKNHFVIKKNKNALIYTSLSLSFILIFTYWAQEIQFFNVNPFALALQYHITSYKFFDSALSWGHLITSLKINLLHYLFILLGFFIFLFNKEIKKSRHFQGLTLLSILSCLIVCIHPEKWTYFVAQFIPFISLPIIIVLKLFTKNIVRIGMIVFLISTPFVETNFHSWFRTNQAQIQTIRYLQNVFDQIPNATYYDSTGLLPKRKGLMTFLGPNDPIGKVYAMELLQNSKPDFIFFTTKLQLANPEISQFLYNYYIEMSTDVWILIEKYELLNDHQQEQPYSLQNLFIFDYQPYLKY